MSKESSEGGPWFAVGAAVGAAVGLMAGLFALPRPGRAARPTPSEAWRRAAERADDTEPDPGGRG